MIQLFKNKSLKSNTKTGQGAGVGAGVRGVGVGAGVRGAGVGAGVRGASNKSAKLTSSLNERTQEKEKSKGRSMVEMLGVLAIIGVLSIGGIQGYTMAMRRYRANEIVNIVSKYAQVVYTSCQQARENDPNSYPTVDLSLLPDYFKFGSFDMKFQNLCPKPTAFKDSGLGSMPTGAEKIGLTYLLSSPMDGSDKTSFTTLSNGKDVIFISVRITTKDLCDTVLATAGDQNYSTDVADIDNYSTGLTQCDEDLSWVVIPVLFN